jgi:hypothetical protein
MSLSTIIIVSIPVADQIRAKHFYSGKLNFNVTMEATDAMGPGKSWITLEHDAASLIIGDGGGNGSSIAADCRSKLRPRPSRREKVRDGVESD